ncbi:hypothetical protein AWB77_06894 [Caballeronia fortuita]|uniref:Uncharacterized protein n=1 Tax=Caballeronia fortuita TaxID=1777138 RepID=A0A158EAT9_9BURK|nr:hypothetical protein AWB77_06894 [Caballeronia fortuita]
MTLAREHEPVIDLVLFERVVLVHLHFAFDHLRAARTAHTALACVRQRKARLQSDIEHAHAFIRQAQLALLAIDDQFQIRRRRALRDLDRRRTRLRQRRAEALHMNLPGRNTRILQRSFGRIHHRSGAADERFIDFFGREQRRQKRLALLSIQHAVEQLHILQIVGQHVIQREPVHIPILQIFKFLGEHDRVHAAIAVHQREAARRLHVQRRLDDRKHRRDARAARERHVVLRMIRVQMREEAAIGRHHVDLVAGLQSIEREVREAPATHALDADAQFAVAIVVGHAHADRIRAARLLAVDMRLERHELSLREAKRIAQRGRHVERNGDRIGGFGSHIADAQRMELRSRHDLDDVKSVQYGLK